MKRFFCILFVLSLLICSGALAEDQDPIVGSWYLCYDTNSYPELAGAFNSDYLVQIYCFLPDGTMTAAYISDSSGQKSSAFSFAGTWSKKDFVWYECNVIGLGTIDGMIVKNETLQLKAGEESNVYLVMNRMAQFNPYKDFVFR